MVITIGPVRREARLAKIPATEFKAKCLEIMDRVSERRETYVITKRGKPVAKLVPVARAEHEPLFGRLRGIAEETGDIVAPAVSPGDWTLLKEWDELAGTAPRRGRERR